MQNFDTYAAQFEPLCLRKRTYAQVANAASPPAYTQQMHEEFLAMNGGVIPTVQVRDFYSEYMENLQNSS